MRWVKWFIIVLAVVEGGWLLFDGVHAFATGDYVTPDSGEYAGQLGRWAKLWEAVGVDPRSTLVKGVHVGLGAIWFVAMISYARNLRRSRGAMLVCAIASLWYLPFGTLISVIQIILLMLPASRGAISDDAMSASEQQA